MDRKKIIQIIVIAIAFVGSGVVLYNGLYRPKAPNVASLLSTVGSLAPVPASPVASGASNALLPYGSKLDFDGTLNHHNLQFDAVQFPVVNTSTEIGVLPADLIK